MKHFVKITLCSLLLSYSNLVAQSSLWDSYQFNNLALNPAFAGIRSNFSIGGILGNQFTGMMRPNQIGQIVTADGMLSDSSNHSFGFQAFNTRYYAFTNLGMDVSYAYRRQIGKISAAVGLKGGFMVQPNVIINNALNMVNPYGGVGVVLNTKSSFLAVSKPILWMGSKNAFDDSKPLFVQIGSSVGKQNNVLLTTSILAEINKVSVGNVVHLNSKVWLSERLGLGGSFRLSSNNDYSNWASRWVLSAEYQFSTSLRLGIAYDSQPFRGLGTSTDNTIASKVFQLYIKYNSIKADQKKNRFNYF